MRLEQHEDHHIGPKRPGSLAHRLFGTWRPGGDWGQFDEEAAVTAIRRARDLGVDFFDTAQAYGVGASERLLGSALRDELSRHRGELVIATKGGLRQTDSGLVRERHVMAGHQAGSRLSIAAT